MAEIGESLHLDRVAAGVTENDEVLDAALLSDGLQLLALDYAHRAAHRPFFAPFLQALRSAPQGELTVPLAEYLASEAISRRTDDDRTLVLATRRFPSA